MTISTERIIEQYNTNRAVVDTTFSDLSVQSLHQWVEQEYLEIDPDFQRRDRWDNKRRSQLIESFLLNIPVPPIYLSSEESGPYQVIDGKQRITAVHSFLENGFKLIGMKVLTELNGLTFSDLPPQIIQKLAIQPAVRAVIVKSNRNLMPNGQITSSPSVDELKYEVFHRLNTGGIKLEAQEIRNAIYSGSFNSLLITLSKNKYLITQLGWKPNSPTVQQMKDVETVLRYFYYRAKWNTSKDFSRSALDSFMKENRDLDNTKLEALRSDFETTMRRVELLFGEIAFHKYIGAKGGVENWHASPNLALFDAVTIPLAELSEKDFQTCLRQKEEIKNKYISLFSDEKFSNAFVGSTGDAPKVATRIKAVKSIIVP